MPELMVQTLVQQLGQNPLMKTAAYTRQMCSVVFAGIYLQCGNGRYMLDAIQDALRGDLFIPSGC